ncbi:signal peptidase II [bacterium]|nr:signal peptidase II [bacterium]
MPQHQPLNRKQRQSRLEAQRRQKRPVVDMYNIIKYFVLCILFSLIAIGMKMVVLNAVRISPTPEIGNGMLTLSEIRNTGAAFGLFAGQQDTIIVVSALAVLVITFIVIAASSRISRSALPAMSFLSTGILMNMLDRIQYGYVIDYIKINAMPNFPYFNVPDIMVVVGAVCLVLAIITRK